jgi:N-acetylmuramoyl-L-alanine amidase
MSRTLYSAQLLTAANDPVRSLPGQPPTFAPNRNARVSNAAKMFGSAYLLVSLFVFPIGCSHREGDVAASLRSLAVELLDAISRDQNSIVPDAVLNHTTCFAIIPSLPGGSGVVTAGGLATCREAPDKWGNPFLISFTGRPQPKQTNLMVFVLSEHGVRMLQSAKLRVGQRARAPLTSTAPVTTQADLNGDSLVYDHAAGATASSSAKGTIKRASAASALSEKGSERFLSSVTSLFNSIIPTGIVIHHTAVLPFNNELPKNVRDVDKFHQARGFEITCMGHIYHIAYHYLILPNGTVKAGRPEGCQGAHAEGYNSYLGIAVVGDFTGKDGAARKNGPTVPTSQQINALVQLCRRLRDRYNIPLQHIVRHSAISSTDCPGKQFPFQYVLQQLAQQPELAARPRG